MKGGDVAWKLPRVACRHTRTSFAVDVVGGSKSIEVVERPA